ncbi:DUF6301 family protein [Nocardia sp. FBN12]|uniref:DUF6301 family protein n=1 Tax=Nocardia sp. FBN12 TaxID=3419766 RepID=UPI003CFCE0F0
MESEEMLAGVEKVVEKVRVAAGFDWTWFGTDLDRFCRVQNWRVAEHTALGAVITTDLDLARPEARWRERDGRAEQVIVFLSDLSSSDESDFVRQVYDHFSALTTGIVSTLGLPTRTRAGSDGFVRWDLASAIVELRLDEDSIFLHFVDPMYRAELDHSVNEEC